MSKGGFGIKWKYRIEHNRPPGKLTKIYRAAMKQLLLELGALWHKSMLKKHFKDSAKSEYNYAPRFQPYVAGKWIRHRTQGTIRPAPLVKEGMLQKSTLRAAIIKSTSRSVSVTMPMPHKAFVDRPDLEFEMHKVSDKDTRTFQEFIKTRLEQLMEFFGRQAGKETTTSEG